MIAIREAAIEEAEALARVINAAFRPAEGFFIYGDRISVDGVREHFATGTFLVAGDYAGSVYVELRGERCYFGMLAVDPAHQGEGIGAALVRAAEEYAVAHGCRTMEIHVVNLRTELPARYEKLGYRLTGTDPWPADEPTKIPAMFLCMEKALGTPECTLIRGGETYRGKQGLDYFDGISSKTSQARGLCLHLVTIPPRARAKPHLHERHESAIYVISGEAGMWYGAGLRQHMWMQAGDYAHIPANVPHLPYNASDTTPCTGLVARTDPNEQESVTLLDIADPGIAER